MTSPAPPIVDAEVIDAHAHLPGGELCPACGAPVEGEDKFCPACGTPRGDAPVGATQTEGEPEQKHFRCNNCGSEVSTDPDQRSYTCPFCDSTYVVEFSPSESNRQRPEFVIGFAVTPEQAQEQFRLWLRDNSWFRPGDLVAQAAADKMRGVYLPFWSFSMLADSSWSASIGEHWYRTETYTETDSKGNTVTKTRQVQETEWWPLSGRHHRYYSGYLVSGSKGLPQAQAERIKPFQLPALKRYAPYFLAGWYNEEYSIDREQAQAACEQYFHQQEQANIGQFLPGDTHRNLAVSTNFSQCNSDLCLLPVYVLSYKYRDKLYRFLVNGQTGKVAGDKPWSMQRVGIAIGAGLVLLLLIILVIVLINMMNH
jgi:DNA-directed RNA polymerase subunit RPC12/RpoP